MLDQSFSQENFRSILDFENRKGVYLEKRFFPEIKIISDEIKSCFLDIKQAMKQGDKQQLVILNAKKNELKLKKELALTTALQVVSDVVSNKMFTFKMDKVLTKNKKDFYKVHPEPEFYFAGKQLQSNISRAYKLKPSDRALIVRQVKEILADELPKVIIRADIEGFYESINHSSILNKINVDDFLSPKSTRLINGILKSYSRLSRSDGVGLPRGIGASAYLAELFMKKIDADIKKLPNLIYYSRYVDDIVAVFTRENSESVNKYKNYFEEIIKSEGLTINNKKTKYIDLDGSVSKVFEYLGYKIRVGNGKSVTRLSNKKINKYRKRIDSAIKDYLNFSKINEKTARTILVKRIRFLTGNTRLVNNKKYVMVGIYYSNDQLDDISDIRGLDLYLNAKISNMPASDRIKNRLNKYSFENGFTKKRFSPFTANDLSKIMKVWKREL